MREGRRSDPGCFLIASRHAGRSPFFHALDWTNHVSKLDKLRREGPAPTTGTKRERDWDRTMMLLGIVLGGLNPQTIRDVAGGSVLRQLRRIWRSPPRRQWPPPTAGVHIHAFSASHGRHFVCMRARTRCSQTFDGAIMTAMQVDVLSHARPRLLSRAEYDRMVDQGLFADERVELIRGILVEMSPIGSRHADPVDVLTRHFVRAMGDDAVVRVQQPFAASDDSEPEPDLALVPPRRYADSHPERAFLVIEVSDESLKYDRETKARLYAASGVPEYWIVDVNGRSVEVFDQPTADGYQRGRRFEGNHEIAPTAFPKALLRVGELFA